jgi:carboxymethylenebutenolidase
MVNTLATLVPELKAAVPFYGMAPTLQDVPKIKARLSIHFAETDERINASWPAYESALKQAKVDYEAFTYPGTQHGFNNDTTPRYDEDAARLAWHRTVKFLREQLTSPGKH